MFIHLHPPCWASNVRECCCLAGYAAVQRLFMQKAHSRGTTRGVQCCHFASAVRRTVSRGSGYQGTRTRACACGETTQSAARRKCNDRSAPRSPIGLARLGEPGSTIILIAVFRSALKLKALLCSTLQILIHHTPHTALPPCCSVRAPVQHLLSAM